MRDEYIVIFEIIIIIILSISCGMLTSKTFIIDEYFIVTEFEGSTSVIMTITSIFGDKNDILVVFLLFFSICLYVIYNCHVFN